jgi:hypothetical protein
MFLPEDDSWTQCGAGSDRDALLTPKLFSIEKKLDATSCTSNFDRFLAFNSSGQVGNFELPHSSVSS